VAIHAYLHVSAQTSGMVRVVHGINIWGDIWLDYTQNCNVESPGWKWICRPNSPEQDDHQSEQDDNQITSIPTLVPQWPIPHDEQVKILWVLEPTCHIDSKKHTEVHMQWYSVKITHYGEPFT